jgi:Protein of unknown function (DUF4035)
MAYASLEPFGEERADLRAGIIAMVIAEVNRDRTKRPQPFTPQDFMPQFDRRFREPEPLSAADELTAKLKRAFGQFEKA